MGLYRLNRPWSCRQECFSCFWRRELIFISPVPGARDFAIFFPCKTTYCGLVFFFRAQYFLISQYVQSSFQTSHFSWVQHVQKKMTSTSQINCKIIWRGTNSHTSHKLPYWQPPRETLDDNDGNNDDHYDACVLKCIVLLFSLLLHCCMVQ